jgi:hypothetical protein
MQRMSISSTTTDRRKGVREMEMHNPAHPGEIVREECLKPLGLSVTAAAEALGVHARRYRIC